MSDDVEIGSISVKSDHEVEWAIENFFSHTEEKCYYSPDFTHLGTKWYFQLYPNGETSMNNVGWISLYLRYYGNDTSPLRGACFIFGVKKLDGTVEQLLSEPTGAVTEKITRIGYPKLLERSVLVRRKSELAPSDTLTIIWTLWTMKHPEYLGSLQTLSRNFSDLFISKRGSDATLVVQGKEFPVHKSILSARSPVLAAMFEADMKEKRTGLVLIEDCDPQAFGEFLMYLYSGMVPNVSNNVFEFYKIADKYDVQDVRSYCCISIISNLSVDNVLDAVMFGRQFGQDDVMRKAQDFFNDNFTKIIPSDKWESFLSENTTVANELLKNTVKEEPWKKW